MTQDKQIFAERNEEMPIFTSPQTIKRSYYDPDSMFEPWNPDDLVLKKSDFSIYEEMLKDDQVSVALTLKKDLTLGGGFDFIPEADGQEDIVEDLEIAIKEDPDWSFEEMLEEVLSAYEFGLSISEKIFRKRSDGKLSLKALLTRHPGPWLMHQDDAGNIIKYEQRGSKGNIDVPREALLHYINRRKFQNPYGTSDLRAAHQAWFTKKHITRWYAIYIEKAASPTPVGKYDSAKASPTARTDLYNALKRLQTKSTIVVPKEFEIEFLEAKDNGEAFKMGIDLFNLFIGRALLIPDLLGFAGSETTGGSFSLGKNQMDIFFKHIQRRRQILERCINNEIVWPIVLHNWGFVDKYPKFRLRPITNEEIMEGAKIWLDAVKSRVWQPSDEEIDHFRDLVNFPSTDADSGEEMPPEVGPDAEDEGDDDGEPLNVDLIETNDGDDSTFARKFRPTSGPFSTKVNFDTIERTLDGAQAAFDAASHQLADEIFSDVIAQINRKKIVQGNKADKVDTIKPKFGAKLRSLLNRELKAMYKKGQEIAQSELMARQFAKPIVDEEFLKIIESEINGFVGDWEFELSKNAKVAMLQAIKDGKAIEDVIEFTNDPQKVALSRFARTKFTEVMNKGRVRWFDESGVVDGYQYSAILDDRTCFSADTLVTMADKSLKPIASIRAGDYVISGNGKKRRVKAVKRAISEDWREIKTKTGERIQTTDTHSFWAFQRGSFGWVEAKDLSKDHGLGRKILRSMRQTIHQPGIKAKKILQPRLLLSEKKGQNDRPHLPGVRRSISSTRQLVKGAPDRGEILRQGMSFEKPLQRNTVWRTDQDMRDMQHQISNQAERIPQGNITEALQLGMSEAANDGCLSVVQKGIRNVVNKTGDILQRRLLSEGWRGNGSGILRPKRAGVESDIVQKGSEVGPIFDRFSDSGFDSDRGGQHILAPESQGIEHTQGCRTSETQYPSGSCRGGSLERQNAVRHLEWDSHSVIPEADETIGIDNISAHKIAAFCYDIEVEHDHSYLVGKDRVIVHNTEICRGLHGKKFKKGTQPIPPMHFNCRSVLIPITMFEPFEPDSKIGQTPIEAFIDEKKGKGFPKQ